MSKRSYTIVCRGVRKTVNRYLNKGIFETTLINGEKVKRKYLIYSETTGSLYCSACRLFGGKSVFATIGFNNWKKAEHRISTHENSAVHRSNILAMKQRGEVLGRIDHKLIYQVETERQYWKNVLLRVVAVVKALASRGLSFRGDKETFGCPQNGNFMMALELIALFDPFLANHISNYGNPGKGHTSYMSFHTYEQFISVMANKVISEIVNEAKEARYFSISVDSTPDVSHTDQLSFIIRYVGQNGNPVERFLCFIDNVGHKSEQMAKAVLDTLEKYDLNLQHIRGQSYDNANNMSGVYAGLQAKIKNFNSLADFVPCSAHSLNLVGTNAATCCKEANLFFGFVQNLYSFFSASTHRWNLLKVSLKNLSETRWSARDDACKSLNKNYDSIVKVLTNISSDLTEKSLARSEAKGILSTINRLEITFMIIFWGNILDRFNSTSKKLQSVEIDLSIVVELYESLINYITELRTDEMFDMFEDKAVKSSQTKQYDSQIKRKKKRTMKNDEINSEIVLSERQIFKINTYFVILDSLLSALKKRKVAYDNLTYKYNFLNQLRSLESDEVYKYAERLQEIYKNDLAPSFSNECVHFQGHIKSIALNKQPKSLLEISNYLKSNDLHIVYPYVDIAVRMFLCTPASNCSAERSFSTLRRIKTYLRSVMSEKRLNSLAVLNIESTLTNDLNYGDIIDEYATLKSRRKL